MELARSLPGLNATDCIDFARTAELCVDSGADVSPDINLYFRLIQNESLLVCS